MQFPKYEELCHVLEPVALQHRVSEWHGFLCGVMAVDITYPLDTSIHILVADSAEICLTDELADQLDQIFQTVRGQMTDSNLQFELCLPQDDAVDLSARVSALASWCDGFLYGLANAGLQDTSTLSADAQEILKDLSKIAQLDGASSGDEEEEASYNEVMEFVRVASLLIAEEIQPLKSSEGLH